MPILVPFGWRLPIKLDAIDTDSTSQVGQEEEEKVSVLEEEADVDGKPYTR